MSFVDSAEAVVDEWGQTGAFLPHASARRAGLEFGAYRLAGVGCQKIGYEIAAPITWSRSTLARFESVLARYGLRAEYGLYAHAKDPEDLEVVTVKDVGVDNALYIDRRFAPRRELLADLTAVFTEEYGVDAVMTGSEVETIQDLVAAVERHVEALRERGDFSAIAALRRQAPQWQGVRFAGFACGKIGYEIPGRIRWSGGMLDNYEALLRTYGLEAGYGVYAHGKLFPSGRDVLAIHDIGSENAIYLSKHYAQRADLLSDLVVLFKGVDD